MSKCEEQGIRTQFMYGEVQIFSKCKLPQFKEIIEQSFKEHKEPCECKHETQSFWDGDTLICVIVKDKTYVVESHVWRMIYFQFLGKIPVTKQYRIFNLRREMEEALEERKIII